METMRQNMAKQSTTWRYTHVQLAMLLLLFWMSVPTASLHASTKNLRSYGRNREIARLDAREKGQFHPHTSMSQNLSHGASGDDGVETFLVQFHPDTPAATRHALINEMGAEVVRWLAPIHVAEVTIHNNSSNGILRESILIGAKSEPNISYMERVGIVRGMTLPNDPDLVNAALMYTPTLLELDRTWSYTMGSADVVIAVLDTGIAFEHKEFQGRVLPGIDIVNNDNDPSDDNGHGTHVSGIAAAAINNAFGAAGICGRCSILPIKVLDAGTEGKWTDIAEGLIYAAEHDADIAILSLGDEEYSETAAEAVRYAVQNDVLIIAAAGNQNSDTPFYPAAFDDVIGVAATDANDNRWLHSNHGDYIDISAPGYRIYATWHELNNTYEGHTLREGTSTAAPHVAGVAGLLLSMDPSRTRADLERILLQSALDLGEPGQDTEFGKGRLDPVAALELELDDSLYSQLSGVVWVDSDADTVISSTEQERIANVQIQIQRSSQPDALHTVYTDENGEWNIDKLYVDDYIVRIVAPKGYQLTTQSERTFALYPGEHVLNLNFGVAEAVTTYKTFLPVMVTE